MLARIVDNWLTNSGELGYQMPFSQLLVNEGLRLLHAPVHHPFEHGKDIVAASTAGELLAYQLKGGDIGLGDLEKIQGQLMALAGTAISYPGVEPPRRPDRVFLVTNGRLTAPARDRLRSFNDAHRVSGLPPIEVIERDQLVGRFVAAHGSYFPVEPSQLNKFLELFLSEGSGPLDKSALADFLRDIVAMAGESPTATELRRVLPSAALLTAYALTPWQRSRNHLGVAEGWLVLVSVLLFVAQSHDLEEHHWKITYELALESARGPLRELVEEAAASEDLVLADLVEGLVYQTRASLVCGYCAALLLSERTRGDDSPFREKIKAILIREQPYMQATGEATVPLLLMVATALEVLGEATQAALLVYQLAQGLVTANQPDSTGAIPDPYHSIENVLLQAVGADVDFDDENFAGQAYTVHVALEWFARRNYRDVANRLWPQITRLHFVEVEPKSPVGLLSHEDPNANHNTWALPQPASWSEIQRQASSIRESEIPSLLWQNLEFLPFLPLIFPYRMTSSIARTIDYAVSNKCSVAFDDPPALQAEQSDGSAQLPVNTTAREPSDAPAPP